MGAGIWRASLYCRQDPFLPRYAFPIGFAISSWNQR